jgi:hypothetical protein
MFFPHGINIYSIWKIFILRGKYLSNIGNIYPKKIVHLREIIFIFRGNNLSRRDNINPQRKFFQET